ncbi:chitinase, partial [Perkinsus chesapeaki]
MLYTQEVLRIPKAIAVLISFVGVFTSMRLPLIIILAFISISAAFEFFVYYTDPNEIKALDQAYFDNLYDCGVTELILGGFSVSSTGEVRNTFDDEDQLRMARKAADNHTARVSFMVTSVPFIDNIGAYATFMKSVNSVLEKYSLDGVNFDWEFPSSHAEWVKYRDLLSLTKSFVGRKGKSAYVTVAVGGAYSLYKDIDLCGPIDMCLWMGYDNHNDPKGQSNIPWVKRMVNQWVSRDLSPKAFGLGVPLYGENRNGTQMRYSQLVANGADPKVSRTVTLHASR